MERAEIASKVREIVADKMHVSEDGIVEKTSFAGDLGADSLDLSELRMALEDAFGLEIPDDAAETLVTVGNAIDFVLSKKSDA